MEAAGLVYYKEEEAGTGPVEMSHPTSLIIWFLTSGNAGAREVGNLDFI